MRYKKRQGERVSVYHGNQQQITIVAPHGPDDDMTCDLALHIAEHLEANAILNNGFEKADAVDEYADQANCNRISHIKDPSIIAEFYDPLTKLVNSVTGVRFVFIVHGFGIRIEKQLNQDIDIILGYGLGVNKNRLSCETDRVKCFAGHYGLLKNNTNSDLGEIFVGKGGGLFAGHSLDNLNQLWKNNNNVQSLQLEFSTRIRNSQFDMKLYSEYVAESIYDFMNVSNLSHYKNLVIPEV